MHMFHLAWLAAAGIAMCSTLFGIGVARLVWSGDIRHATAVLEEAREIDFIRSQTEQHLMNQIKVLEKHVDYLKQQEPTND